MLSQFMRTNQGVPPRPVRVFLTGPSRSGKTSCALSFPNPLLVSAKHENGSRVADNLPFHVSVIECDAFRGKGAPSLKDVLKWANAEARNGTLRRFDGSPVGTFILDSGSHFESILLNEIAPDGTMSEKRWGELLEEWKELQAILWQLPVNVVITCLDKVKTTKAGAVVGHGPALQGQIGALLPAACDITGYCEQEHDGKFYCYVCRRGAFTGGTRLIGMPNAPYHNFSYGAHIAPYLGGPSHG